ncbi:hypothetical protein D3C80_1359700 [compost metagenome]
MRPGRASHARLLSPPDGHLGGRDRQAGLFRLRPAVRRAGGPAQTAAVAPQGPTSGPDRPRPQGRRRAPALRRAFQRQRPDHSGKRLPDESGGGHLQEAGRPLSGGPRGLLGQVQVPGARRGGDRRLVVRGRQPLPLPAGRGEGEGRPALPGPRRHGLLSPPDPDASARAESRRRRPFPLRRRRPARDGRPPPLDHADPRRRDRTRRLFRGRHPAPGRLQGPA